VTAFFYMFPNTEDKEHCKNKSFFSL